MKKTFCLLTLILSSLLTACVEDNNPTHDYTTWQTITATNAQTIMEESENFILLDVRTPTEFQNVRIDGAILIPYNEINSRAVAELSDKNAIILVYCQSGRRSASAAADLAALGFTSVFDFGGILSWPYETVSD